MVLSCGHTICNQCKEFQFQNGGSYKNCPIDDSCQLQANFKMLPNKVLINNLDKVNFVNITCDTHPDKMVKKYCKTSKQLLCNICATTSQCTNHQNADHLNVLRKELEDHIHLKIPLLKNLIERIQLLIRSLQQYQSKDKMFKAGEFFDLMNKINEYLGSNQRKQGKSLFNIGEWQLNDLRTENLENLQILIQKQKLEEQKNKQEVEIQKQEVVQDNPNNLIFRRMVDYHLESLKYPELKGFYKLLPLIGQSKLIFKASIDGFLASSFHSKCDNQGPIISFIQSEHGQIFGAYTSVPWTSNRDKWISDNEAFVFSLSKNTLHKQHDNYDFAVNHHDNNIITLGGGHDIFISNKCNDNSDSYCNLGHVFMAPQGFEYGDEEASNYLAGSEKFIVIEMEMYQVLT
ncbi:tldc domain-containing protein [Stylonychia lemnae]|uniref:Tldc domain-containing protein n=1 Tax=Stylonychia lemnae TaxID=5949 RepID=A0A078AQ12_STYLE|nr:tldc domain-containing protein [Stylonychia lemnae]|eukprot:CDW83367.1 tldc domain-containing protein [Stylonychia lemnae]